MTKILIAEIYAGGFGGDQSEKKGSFTTDDIEQCRAELDEGEDDEEGWD